MQVNLNVRPTPPAAAAGSPVASRKPDANASELATFERSAAIESALKELPDSRAEAVVRGEAVIGMPQYPPLDGIKRISRLLAANWPSTSE